MIDIVNESLRYTANDGRILIFETVKPETPAFNLGATHAVKIDEVIMGYVSEMNQPDERLAMLFLRLFRYRGRKPEPR